MSVTGVTVEAAVCLIGMIVEAAGVSVIDVTVEAAGMSVIGVTVQPAVCLIGVTVQADGLCPLLFSDIATKAVCVRETHMNVCAHILLSPVLSQHRWCEGAVGDLKNIYYYVISILGGKAIFLFCKLKSRIWERGAYSCVLSEDQNEAQEPCCDCSCGPLLGL